jgi:hypothetical protein
MPPQAILLAHRGLFLFLVRLGDNSPWPKPGASRNPAPEGAPLGKAIENGIQP